MKHNLVVTIGRQYGSGGREVGRRLAKLLNIDYYDKELITEASRMSGICSEILEQKDEKTPGSFSHAFSVGFGFTQGGLTPENIFKIQSDAIIEIAEKSPCVIVGRSADYVLRNNPCCFNIFILAPEEDCVNRIMERSDVPRKKAVEMRHKTNKNRSSYYNFYTNKKWGGSESYHLTIDSSLLGLDGTAEFLYDFVLAALKEREEICGCLEKHNKQ